MYKLKKMLLVISLLLFLLDYSTNVLTQQVTHYTEGRKYLKGASEWALQTAKQKNIQTQFWIGYSILRFMENNSFIGNNSPERNNQKTLYEIIDSTNVNHYSNYLNSRDNIEREAQYELYVNNEVKDKVSKELAILLKMELLPDGSQKINDVKISNMELSVDLQDFPLFWLDRFENVESVLFLQELYRNSQNIKIKEDLMVAVALHQESEKVFEFLKSILISNEPSDLRKKSAFWIGQQNLKESLLLLQQTAETDSSHDVRKEAVFAINIMKLDTAVDVLIDLARTAKDKEVRKTAIFWLGQKAGDKSVSTLEKVVFDEKETDVQESAVFALSQLRKHEGIPRLINVANSHPNPQVRKKAIFWLGQSGDDRATEALIKLVKGE